MKKFRPLLTLLDCFGLDGDLSVEIYETDYQNYLYVTYLFYKKSTKRELSNILYKEKTIGNKYYLGIKIEDAFNQIDPNNFAPN